MKNLITGFSFFLSILSASAQNKLLISGKTTAFANDATITISEYYPFKSFFSYPSIVDSTVIQNNEFHLLLKGVSSEFFDLSITLKNGDKATKRVFLEPSATKIFLQDPKLKNVKIIGNKTAEEYASLKTEIQKVKPPQLVFVLWKKYDSLQQVDAKQALQIYQKIDSISRVTGKKQAVIANNWIDPHPGSFLNSYIIYQMLRPYISDDSLKKRVNELSGMATKNSWGRELRYIINHTIKGAKAPHFKQEDTSSNKHSLEEFTGKGNYIFIDFWASWCGPCRHQNPSLRRIYSDFKNKNLTMIGISLDKDKESWVKAIQKDNLQWLQLSDLQFQNNKAAKAFYINSIPSNFLLDPAGKIIARNLTTNELRERLSQLLQ